MVSDQVFKQFKAGYEQAQKNGTSKQQQSLSSLGLDPRQWLTNPKNEGETKVGDDDVIKITGGIDVNKLLEDVNQALQKTKSLGVQGTQNLPSQLTAAQKQQVTDAIKDPKVEIYTGKDDKILRRMVISLGVVAPKGSSTSGSADHQLRPLDLGPERGPDDLRAVQRQAVRPAALAARRARPRRPRRRRARRRLLRRHVERQRQRAEQPEPRRSTPSA